MRRDLIIYAVSAIVIFVSFAAALFIPVPPQFQGVVTLPGVIALFSLIVQAWRDQRAHERKLELQWKQQDFTLGIASHMANVTFDKLVVFCEEYFQAAHEILQALFMEGPTETALSHSKRLMNIRIKYSPWLPQTAYEGLLPFERALRTIAAESMVKETLPVGDMRSQSVRNLYETFSKVIDLRPLENGTTPEEGIAGIIAHLREVLRIGEITSLRERAIGEAFARLTAQNPKET